MMILGLISMSLISHSAYTPWYRPAIDAQEGRFVRAQNTIVAIIDTGLDTKHPALRNALWTNPGESGKDSQGRDKSTNGIDDDKNGFIDDIHGWNFASQSSNIEDEHGHGTHIAGLIAADHPDFQGIAPGTKLMILKYYDPKAPIGGNLMSSVRAIKYALRMGAHIINYSGGGFEPFPAEREALLEAEKKGVLVVAAAGNENANADALAFYPASYKLSNILPVMALSPNQKRLPASNWGPKTVKVSAPGEQILSTFLEGQMAYMSGTSQATAVVTGIAVLLREKKSLREPAALIQTIMESGGFNQQILGQTAQPQKVSLKRALLMENSFSEEPEQALSTYKPR